MRIESIELKNYRLFCHTALMSLPPMAIVVGANGSGKSTLFDALSFLKDALTQNVAHAVARRGGFEELIQPRAVRCGRHRCQVPEKRRAPSSVQA